VAGTDERLYASNRSALPGRISMIYAADCATPSLIEARLRHSTTQDVKEGYTIERFVSFRADARTGMLVETRQTTVLSRVHDRTPAEATTEFAGGLASMLRAFGVADITALRAKAEAEGSYLNHDGSKTVTAEDASADGVSYTANVNGYDGYPGMLKLGVVRTSRSTASAGGSTRSRLVVSETVRYLHAHEMEYSAGTTTEYLVSSRPPTAADQRIFDDLVAYSRQAK